MAELPEVFTMKDAEASFNRSYDKGWYAVEIIKGLIKKKDSKTYMTQLFFEFLDEKYAPNVLMNNYNIINQSRQTVQIAKMHLRQICESVGVEYESFKDTDEILGKNLQIYIEPSKNSDFPNNITKYRSVDEEIEEAENNPF